MEITTTIVFQNHIVEIYKAIIFFIKKKIVGNDFPTENRISDKQKIINLKPPLMSKW